MKKFLIYLVTFVLIQMLFVFAAFAGQFENSIISDLSDVSIDFDTGTFTITISGYVYNPGPYWYKFGYTVTFTPEAGGEPIRGIGKWMDIYKRQPDGSWKIYRGIYNSDLPPSGSQ